MSNSRVEGEGRQLVPSVSIANLLNQRAAVMDRLGQAVALIREAADIAAAAHLGMPRFEVHTDLGQRSGVRIGAARVHPTRDGSAFEQDADAADDVTRAVRVGVDAGAWQYLMHESGLRSLMDTEARRKWDAAIYEGEVPELTLGTVRSTFRMLHDGRAEMFERGVVECFRQLSWAYKTNLPQRFGKRIVLTHVRSQIVSSRGGGTSLGYPNHERCNRLDDLVRVFSVLDGKPEPDHRQGWFGRLMAVKSTDAPIAQDDYLALRSFRNGSGHVTFKRPDLVDHLNRIIAKHYPGALPEPK